MRANSQKLVADAPSEERRCSITACIVQALAANQAEVRALVRSMKEHVGVEDQQLLALHRTVQRVTVININQPPTTIPHRQ